jgi:hypothetical protein
MALIMGGTAAFAQNCAEDRTPLVMGGHTLCLPTESLPHIFLNENGEAYLLNWSNIANIAAAAPVPPGTFHLSVMLGSYNSPTAEQTESSDLPGIRQIISGRSTYLFPSGVFLNEQPFQLRCNKISINPQHALQGGQDCEIDAYLAPDLWINLNFGTVVWADGPAWPKLDENWGETWPPYLANLEAGINNLLSIQ